MSRDYDTAKEMSHILMELFMLVSGKMVSCMGREWSDTSIIVGIRGIGKRVGLRGLVFGRMAKGRRLRGSSQMES